MIGEKQPFAWAASPDSGAASGGKPAGKNGETQDEARNNGSTYGAQETQNAGRQSAESQSTDKQPDASTFAEGVRVYTSKPSKEASRQISGTSADGAPILRSRCHFSIIFESVWKFLAFIIIMFINELDNFLDIIKDLRHKSFAELMEAGGMIGFIVFFVIVIGILLIQFLRWRKTWVSLTDNLIIVERNTLQRRKNTIALENVSTVNIERTIFERVVGTSRIKIDTASSTTAKETDVSIVFKEQKAMEFRRMVLDKMSQMKGTASEVGVTEKDGAELVPREIAESGNVFTYTKKQMVMHCVYSAGILATLITLAGIVGSVLAINFAPKVLDFVEEVAGSMPLVFMVLGAAYSLVSKYIKYYNFRVYRDGDELHLRYGLLKLKSYTLPIDKIVSITLEQPVISRFCKKYQTTVKTVGLADEKGETPNITLALSKEELLAQLSVLLPEYDFGSLMDNMSREKGISNRTRLFKSVKWLFLIAGIAGGFFIANPDEWYIAAAIAVVMFVYMVAMFALSHKSAGWAFGERYLCISGGFFVKRFHIFNYDKIQLIQKESHPVGRKHGLLSGDILFLAHRVAMPYMPEAEVEKIEEKMLAACRIRV